MIREKAPKVLLVLLVLLPVLSFASLPYSPDPASANPDFDLLSQGKAANLGRFGMMASPADSAHDYDVLKYTLNIKLVPSVPSNKFRGHVTINAKSKIPNLTTVALDFIGMSVDSCKVNSVPAVYVRAGNQLLIDLGGSYGVDTPFTIDIVYQGNPQAGFYFRTNGFGNPIYYSFTEPYDSRYWFPCYDLPNDKAQCEVICTAPAGNIAVSNGKLLSVTNNPDTTVTYHWVEDYQIATYLMSLTVSNFAQIDTFATILSETLGVHYWVYHQDSTKALVDFAKTPKMIEHFSDLWVNYPFIDDKYSMAEIYVSPGQGAMEHQTCTSWGFPMTGDARYEYVVAHELSHHWWGDMVTCNDFANIWLNEGFASYSEVLWQEYEYGQTAKNNHLISFQGNIFASANGSVKYPIYNPPSQYLFGTAVYKKGAWVLNMLRNLLGDSLFFHGMAYYGQQHMFSTANTEQFKNDMESYSGRDLDWFFNQWVYSPNYPKYNWSWAYTSLGANHYLNLSINQKQTSPTAYNMPIQFKVTLPSKDTIITLADSLKDQTFALVLGSAVSNVVFDPNYWLLSADTLKTYPATPGDLNGDGLALLSDVIYLVNILFRGWALPNPAALADVGGDCKITLSDAIYFVNYFYHSGPALNIGCP